MYPKHRQYDDRQEHCNSAGAHLHAQADSKEGPVLPDVLLQRLRETLGVQGLHRAPERPYTGKHNHLSPPQKQSETF